MRRALAIVALVLAMVATAAPATAAPMARMDESATIFSLVNQARAGAGLPPLNRNSAIDGVAATWAAQMAANGTMSHNPAYAAQIPAGWTAAAENVASGQPSGSAMHTAWMGSAPHRANILGNFTDVGIAFLVAGGTTWGVEVFANYPGSVVAAPPPPPPPPPPAAPPPAEPAPEEPAQAEPTSADTSSGASPVQTQSESSGTPEPAATTSATEDDSDPEGDVAIRTTGQPLAAASTPITPPWWSLAAALTVLAVGAGIAIRRRVT